MSANREARASSDISRTVSTLPPLRPIARRAKSMNSAQITSLESSQPLKVSRRLQNKSRSVFALNSSTVGPSVHVNSKSAPQPRRTDTENLTPGKAAAHMAKMFAFRALSIFRAVALPSCSIFSTLRMRCDHFAQRARYSARRCAFSSAACRASPALRASSAALTLATSSASISGHSIGK